MIKYGYIGFFVLIMFMLNTMTIAIAKISLMVI
jgi:hypothetical protein